RHELRLVAAVRAPEEADDVDVLHQHDVRGYLRDAAAGKADDDDAPLPGDRTQALVEGIAADRIVDDIDATTTGDVLDAIADLLARVVDEMVGAGTSGDGELVRATRGGDDLGAHRLGDLDRGQSDAAGSAEHQHPFARLQPGAPSEGAVGCAIGDGETRGGDKIHAVGDAVDAVGLGDDFLGKAAAPDRGEHAVTALQMRDAGARLGDGARHLH